VQSEANFARFTAEPLERGFGTTLGNALRRVLLGYLPGAAITQVKIDGIRHEFATIPHATEDVIDFLLNVKAIRIKPLSNQGGKLVLDVQGEGRVCAADIKPSNDFEITNQELCLLTLNSPDARLYVEFTVEMGEGYRSAESGDNMPVDTIPVDAIFTPIRKVNFTTQPVHLGRETSQERLVLEIWTDGTIVPVDAVSQAASIMVDQLTPFVDYIRVSQMKAEEQLIRLSIPDEKYNMPVEQMDLSVRTMNCLRRGGITTVGELISKKPRDLLQLRNFGQKSYREIEDRLQEMGLSLQHSGLKEEKDLPLESELEESRGSEPEEAATGEGLSGEVEDET
jgi:DNA-directed RNA polymerase subunit alpha